MKLIFFVIFSCSSAVLADNQWNYLCDNIPKYDRIPHPNDCQRYFVCMEDGVAHEGVCPLGDAYDIVLEFCYPEKIVDCSHISTTTSESTTST